MIFVKKILKIVLISVSCVFVLLIVIGLLSPDVEYVNDASITSATNDINIIESKNEPIQTNDSTIGNEVVTEIASDIETTQKANTDNLIQAANKILAKNLIEENTEPQIQKGEYGIKTINGSLKNISGRTLSYVQITFAIYDSDGAQVGTAIDNINNLTAGSVWKYSAISLGSDDWISFELTEVDAY